MFKRFYRLLIFVFITFLLSDCARRGRPEGGPKDENAPIMVTATPPYETTKFDAKNIRIYFDEYITLRDLTKQLVVSPPLKNPAVITPQGTPSKYINIKILDTLKQNTTYIFNFGKSIQDNNEGNELESFKYVFSTGDYIDSLTLKGEVLDAFDKKKLKDVNVALYRLDSTFTDSIVYKQKPNYVTSTLDSTLFKFSNLRKGNYLLMALKEESNDYLFNAKTDKIGFVLDTISLPKDSVYNKPIKLFKELQAFNFKRGKEVSKGKIQFGFTGEKKDFNVKLLSKVPEGFKSVAHYEKNKDTLNYWFTPFEKDSLNFIVSQEDFIDTITVKLRKKKLDSLQLSSTVGSSFHPRDTFFVKANNPIISVDASKITIFNKDTVKINFKEELSTRANKFALLFDRKFEDSYNISILPDAITDIYNQKNDTLNYRASTRKIDDYGIIELDVQNVENKNVIIELVTSKVVVEKVYLNTSKKLKFEMLEPKDYTIRAIIDSNNDKSWTTGDYLKKRQPEKIIYFENEIELRANWTVNEIFTIK